MFDYQTLVRTLGDANAPRIAIEDAASTYTYAQWHRRTSELAAGLRARGLQEGDTLMWLSPNTAQYLIAYFGTGKAGVRVSPLNFWLRDGELRAAFTLIRPAVVVVHPDHLEKVAPIVAELDVANRFVLSDAAPDGWEPWSAAFDDGAAPDADYGGRAESPHEIIFTSGTTGQVKGVARTQRQRILESTVSVMVQPHGRRAFVLRGSPQFHVGGGTGPIQTLLQGGRTRIVRFSPATVAENVREGVTHVSGVPAQYHLLFDSGNLDGVDTTGVRCCAIGGNGAAPAQFLRIQHHFPDAELLHFYGSTESGMVSSICGEEFLERLSSIGRPAPGVDVRLVAEDGHEVERGEVGEIQVRSQHMMTGYFGRDDLTTEAFTSDGFLRMGDLARQDDDGYLYIVGRKKDMIISGGENIYPKEIEDVVSGIDFVAEVAVIGTPDEVFEERVIAVVRLQDGMTAPDETFAPRVMNEVRDRLAGYKAPKEVHFIEEFPRNALGKIDRVALRLAYAQGPA